MLWEDFLGIIADAYGLSFKEKKVFQERFSDENANEKNIKIATKLSAKTQLSFGLSDIERFLKEIYTKFAQDCSGINSNTKGKSKILYTWLKKQYAQYQLTGKIPVLSTDYNSQYQLTKEIISPVDTPEKIETYSRKDYPIFSSIKKKYKSKLIKVAIMRNGEVLYTGDIRNGIYQRIEIALSFTDIALVIKDYVGSPEKDSNEFNEKIFANVMSFRPDIIVTIGTEVSIFSMKKCQENRIPMIAVGVGDPIKTGIINEETMQAAGNINLACVRYGIPLIKRVDFLANLFDQDQDPVFFYFIYNSCYRQDEILAAEITQLLRNRQDIDIKLLKLTDLYLEKEYDKRRNIFFGFYFLNKYLSEFISSTQNASFIGLSPNDMRLGAIASICQNDYSLGVLAADKILLPWIFKEKKSLSQIKLVEPEPYYSLNIRIIEEKQLNFSRKAIDMSSEIFK